MSLTDPAVHYNTIRDAIVTLLRANVATLNANLTRTTFSTTGSIAATQILAGDPLVENFPSTRYPMILVKIIKKTEKFLEIGNAGRKRPILIFRIFGMVQDMSHSQDTEIMYLTQNIEAIFRNNITISDAVELSDLGDADFGMIVGEKSFGYVDLVAIDLACSVEVK